MPNVWKIAPGRKAEVWKESYQNKCISINWLNNIDLKSFQSPQEVLAALKKANEGKKGSASSIWAFANKIKPGDVVVANDGKKAVVGLGLITSDYLSPENELNPNRSMGRDRHAHLVDWIIDKRLVLSRELFVIPTVQRLKPKQYFQIKHEYLAQFPELSDKLDKLFPDPGQGVMTTTSQPSRNTVQTLLEQFKQIILYGPPGTGKTREAKRVALSLLSGKDDVGESTEAEIEAKLKAYREEGRFDLVVFHPAYEYEQFVGGIEPELTGGNQLAFRTKAGVFLLLCRKAEKLSKPVVLIIDEINRGHLPKLLGELVYALEYRDHEVSLPNKFDGRHTLVIPSQLYIIGTMNSADRSIGHIDVAIRRRFGLCSWGPNADVVRQRWTEAGDPDFGVKVAKLMERINKKLAEDGDANSQAEHGVGHSYFLPTNKSVDESKECVRRKWTFQIQPLLREYAQMLTSGEKYQAYLGNKTLDDAISIE